MLRRWSLGDGLESNELCLVVLPRSLWLFLQSTGVLVVGGVLLLNYGNLSEGQRKARSTQLSVLKRACAAIGRRVCVWYRVLYITFNKCCRGGQ